MKILLLVIFGIASLWDGFTTVAGTYDILGSGWGQLAGSVAFALVILGFLVGTLELLERYEDWHAFVVCLVSFFWLSAFGYDLFTSYVGNCRFIIGGSLNASKTFILIGLTVFISVSPVCLSYLWKDME